MQTPKRQTLLYHITSLANLPGIVEQGGLWAKNRQAERGVEYASIAHENIQGRRATRVVPCGPGGVLHDYVPFYFAPRSPMLYAIHRGRVEGFTGGQRRLAYIVSSVEEIEAAGVPFVFSDGHAVIEFSRMFDSTDHLDQVDWAIMRERYWRDTIQDNDRSRRRQAEFLVHGFCPWPSVLGVAVYGDDEAAEVQELIADAEPPRSVVVRRTFYYDG